MMEHGLFTESVMKTIGERIKTARKTKGYKAIDFADIIGIGKDQLSRIENGKVPCKTEYLFVISQLLDISVDYLMFGNVLGSDIQELVKIVGNKENRIRKIKQIAYIIFEDED